MKTIESPEAGPLGSQHHHPSRGWSRFSPPTIKIRYRLPLLIGILLAGVILAATWASYAEIRASALGVGRERLANLTSWSVRSGTEFHSKTIYSERIGTKGSGGA